MTPMTGLIVLVGSSLLLWLLLLGLAVARKLRRDRRELHSGARRARYQAVLNSGDAAAIASLCGSVRGVEAEADLSVSIDAAHRTLSRAEFGVISGAIESSSLFP